MTKWIAGNDLKKRLNLRNFEIFNLVKEGVLHPADQDGRLIPPPNVQAILKHEKNAEIELELLPYERGKEVLLYPAERESFKAKIDAKEKILRKEIEAAKKELATIPDIHSWANYPLPDDQRQTKAVYKILADALYLRTDIPKPTANQSLAESVPTGAATPTPKPKLRSRSSVDRETARAYANKIRKEAPNKTRAEAAKEITSVFKNKYKLRSISSWISDVFPPEAKKRGAPKKINTREAK